MRRRRRSPFLRTHRRARLQLHRCRAAGMERIRPRAGTVRSTTRCRSFPAVMSTARGRKTAGLRTVDNLIDVYVLGEPGFPEQWVLDLGITEDEFKAKYPGKTVP